MMRSTDSEFEEEKQEESVANTTTKTSNRRRNTSNNSNKKDEGAGDKAKRHTNNCWQGLLLGCFKFKQNSKI